MQLTEKAAFGVMFAGYMTEVYEKAVTVNLLTIWWAAMKPYPVANIKAAFGRYITDPNDCRFAPKPGDIIRCLERASADDDRPGADEA